MGRRHGWELPFHTFQVYSFILNTSLSNSFFLLFFQIMSFSFYFSTFWLSRLLFLFNLLNFTFFFQLIRISV
jgi:hypothetical protein